MHNWYIDGWPPDKDLGSIEAKIVNEPIVDAFEYDPDFRMLIVESPDGMIRIHSKWIGPPYGRASWKLIDDQHMPVEKAASALEPGDRFMLGPFEVRVIFQDYGKQWITIVRDETLGHKLRYYWARGNILRGYMEVWLVYHLNKIGLASTPEACWPMYDDIHGVKRGKYLWRRMTKTVRSWKSAAGSTRFKMF